MNNLSGVSPRTRPSGGGLAERAAADEAARRPLGDIDAADRSVRTALGEAIVDQTVRGGRSGMSAVENECRGMTREDAILRGWSHPDGRGVQLLQAKPR